MLIEEARKHGPGFLIGTGLAPQVLPHLMTAPHMGAYRSMAYRSC